MNDDIKAVVIAIFLAVMLMTLAFLWGYEIGFEDCMDELGIPVKKFIEFPIID